MNKSILFLFFIFLSSCSQHRQNDKISYYNDGSIRSLETYNRNGQLDGNCKYYFKGSQKIQASINYINGIKKGKSLTFYENGSVETSSMFANNKLQGKYYSYFPNGRNKSIENFVDGNRDGEFLSYYDNAQNSIDSKLLYVDNHPASHSYFYSESGNILKYSCYSMDGKLGYFRMYNPDGSIKKDTGLTILSYYLEPKVLYLSEDSIVELGIIGIVPPHCFAIANLVVSNRNNKKEEYKLNETDFEFFVKINFGNTGLYKFYATYSLYDSVLKTTKTDKVNVELEVKN